MSRHYLLDGYNVIHKMPQLADKTLERARRGLIRLIESARPQGSRRNAVTVVFDGKAGVWSPEEQSGEVKIIFTKDETADEKIKRMVDASRRRTQMTVVTDDREIRYYVSALGASVLGVEAFCSRMFSADRSPSAPGAPKKITKSLERKINEELEDIWLKDPPVDE